MGFKEKMDESIDATDSFTFAQVKDVAKLVLLLSLTIIVAFSMIGCGQDSDISSDCGDAKPSEEALDSMEQETTAESDIQTTTTNQNDGFDSSANNSGENFTSPDKYSNPDNGLANSQTSTKLIDDSSIGDVVAFGTYGSKTLEWIVLDIQDGKALLVTKDIVKTGDVFIKSKDTWATCGLRNHLNNDLYSQCFTSSEQQRIALTPTEKGAEDYLFLLSPDDAERYFSSNASRVVKYAGTDHWWWLRSSSSGNSYQPFVDSAGNLYKYGGPTKGTRAYEEVYSDTSSGGIRPAMWVDL
jgi:hypothetical protein